MIPASDVEFMGPTVAVPTDDVTMMGTGAGGYGTGAEYVSMLGAATTPQELACAEKAKPSVYLAAGCTLGTIGTGLFGVYKLFKGRPAAGVTSIVGAGIFYVLGAAFGGAAAQQYLACTAEPPRPKLPGG